MSKISRRAFNAGLVTAGGAGLAGLQPARAESFANHDVTFVCGFAAGSGADVTVRFISNKMQPMLGRNVIVENKVGALSNIATEYVARSKPDGHTIYLNAGDVLAANQNIIKNPTVDVGKDLQAFGTILRLPYMLVVRGDSPYKTLTELTATMKEKGAKATYGFANGGGVKVVGALYKEKAGLQASEVAYRVSADYLNDLGSGNIDYAIADGVTGAAQARQGRVRVLAVSTPQRVQTSPDYPTLTELGYPVSLVGWWGGFVASATSRPIVEQLGKMLSDVMSSDEGKKFFLNNGAEPWVQTPDQTQAYLRQEVKDWADYVRIAKIEKIG